MEKKYVPAGVFLTCDKGTLPSQLSVTFNANTSIYGQSLATEADKVPMMNVKPMGVCAITKGPCVPAPVLWNPVQNDVVVGNNRLLLEDSKLQCSAGGKASIFFSLAAAQAACPPAPVEKTLLDKADDYLATLGPAGDYARFQMGMAEGLYAGGKSMAEGLWGLAKGGWHAATHPVETANAIGNAASSAADWASKGENWSNAAGAAGDGISSAADWASHGENWGKAWDGASEWAGQQSPRDWGKIGGRATFEVALAVGTGGTGTAANVAGKAGTAANLLSKAGEVANLADKGLDVARLADKGLDAANLAGKAAEASNAAGKAGAVGKVTTGADKAADAARAAKAAEEAAAKKAAQELETVEGAAKNKRTCKCDPVDVTTGAMLFDAVDIDLPGPVPFTWERTWYSNSTRCGPLGHGWHHRYDRVLWQDPAGRMNMRLGDGRLATFEPLEAANDHAAYHRSEKLTLRRATIGATGYAVFDGRERLTYHFAPAGNAPTETIFHLLQAVTDASGNALRFSYDHQGYLNSITDSAGRIIGVQTDAAGRIRSLDLPDPNNAQKTFSAVQYQYDEAGNMTAAIDAEGHTTHFAYEGYLLVKKTFREGTHFYFEYDAQARCTRTWGDENYYNGRFVYEPGQTTLYNEEPAAKHEYYHENGLVTTYIDPVGAVHQWHYNAHNELELARDPLGNATSYDYDARGNQTGIGYPDGTRTAMAHNDQDLLVAATDVNGNSWQWRYDEVGSLISRFSPDAATTAYRYDDYGRLTEIVDANENTTRLRYGADHQLTHLVSPDEQVRSFAYDALGRLIHLTDARGNAEHRQYDRMGRLARLREADGHESILTYDGEGNIVRAQDGQQDVRFAYTAVNRMAVRRQEGQQTQFFYDREGRLVGVRNEAGQQHLFVLDAAGQVVEETGFDDLTRRYAYDAAGRVSHLYRSGSQSTVYAYDAADRVTEITHDGAERVIFRYRADGLLAVAATAASRTEFEYDPLGRLLREIQDGHVVESQYDRLGFRQRLHSSLGADVHFERDLMGRVIQVRAGNWHQSSQRDAEGLELQRLMSSSLCIAWQRDAVGRPSSQRIMRGHTTLRQRRYQWQAGNNLAEIEDSFAGTARFSYDAFGALTTAQYPKGADNLGHIDATGSPFVAADKPNRAYGPGGQLRQANGTRYRYDAEGNLSQKTTPDGQTWRYEWNGAGQLARVIRPDGYAVAFAYDALGRRVSKHFRGRVTRWVWDGDNVLHEWHELAVGAGPDAIEALTTWLFEEGGSIPCAKLTARGNFDVAANQVGAPLALFNDRGTQVWGLDMDTHGAVRQGQGHPQDCAFRYQGQYEDVETGLYYNRFRYYDPETGGYISQDPIGLAGGPAPYAYVADPLTQIDPLGLSEGSTTLGNRMSRAGTPSSFEHGISPFPRSDFRAHHVIPHDVWTQPQNQRFFDNIGLGSAKDRAANGVFLPKSEAVGQSYGFENYHSGSHATYNNNTATNVADIRDRYNSRAITRTQARKEISALQKEERKRLSKRNTVAGPCARLN